MDGMVWHDDKLVEVRELKLELPRVAWLSDGLLAMNGSTPGLVASIFSTLRLGGRDSL
jgi:hypothetical protein